MASMYVNDSSGPSFCKGVYSHMLRYSQTRKGEYSEVPRTVGPRKQDSRRCCMTCLAGQRSGRRMTGRLGGSKVLR